MNNSLCLGIVVIGRNEGKRLEKCLQSCGEYVETTIYVDSCSTDNSLEIAKRLEFDVLELDSEIPLSAARARNEGFAYLISKFPDLKFIQFIDGDCTLEKGWMLSAMELLEKNVEIGVACGQLIEQSPSSTIYNQLCQVEWDTPTGEIDACGGIFMIRSKLFANIEGFNPSVIAAEDDELCIRVRLSGYKIMKLDQTMAYHDADMSSFIQWWKRSKRAGHAFAQVNKIHGKGPYKYFQKEMKSILFWTGVYPFIVLILFMLVGSSALSLLFMYLLLVYKIKKWRKSDKISDKIAWLYGINCVVAKFPQMTGILQFYINRLFHKQSTIIEYKKGINSFD